MVFALGVLLIGSHFLMLIGISYLCAIALPDWGLFIFLGLALLSGFAMINVQTRLEAFFIRQHLKRNPNSGWAVVVPNHKKNIAQKSVPSPEDDVVPSWFSEMVDTLWAAKTANSGDASALSAAKKRVSRRLSRLSGFLRDHLERSREQRVLRREQSGPLGRDNRSPAR